MTHLTSRRLLQVDNNAQPCLFSYYPSDFRKKIFTCILINDCILQDFKPTVHISIEDVKHVWEMLCEYILKETIDRKGNFYSGASWVYCDQKLETHSVFFSQVLLPEKPAWLAWLGSDTAWFRQFSHDSIQTSPDESNLNLDVILACL
jgi:hypothetical protein